MAGERVADGGAGGQVPDPHRAVVAAGDDDRAAASSAGRHRDRTQSAWPVSGSPTGVPVARSQTRTVSSLLPEMTTGRPASSAAATAVTEPAWPVNGAPIGVPVARSQTRTVWSLLPEMTTGRPSSSAAATALHRAGVAGERVADRGAGGQVPDPHRPVVAAGDDDRAAVQLRRPPPHRTQSAWPVNGSPIGVPVARSQTRTVRSLLPEMTTGRPVQLRHRHRVHRAGVAGERVADRGAGGQVPDPHRPVVAAGDDHRAAVQLRHRHRVHRIGRGR